MAVFVMIWLSIVFLNGSLLIYNAALGWRQLFNLKNGTRVNIVTGIVVFILCMNIGDFMKLIIAQYLYYEFISYLMMALLVVIWIAAKIYQKRGAGQHEKA